jgi:hypothetical protein
MSYRANLQATFESVEDVALSAQRRLDEAEQLLYVGRHHTAIYLAGLSAEMYLKVRARVPSRRRTGGPDRRVPRTGSTRPRAAGAAQPGLRERPRPLVLVAGPATGATGSWPGDASQISPEPPRRLRVAVRQLVRLHALPAGARGAG